MEICATGLWTIKERLPGARGWLEVKRVKNLLTLYGLGSLVGAYSGSWVAPQYLALNSFKTTVHTTITPGATSVVLDAIAELSGDTQLVLSMGVANQEVVTFTGRTGSGPYTYTLTAPTVLTHTTLDIAGRQVNQNDTISSIITPVQYDPVNAPNQRQQAAGGYATGSNGYTVQFYMSASQAVSYIATVGLTDTQTIGTGNLHNHFVLAYDHSAGVSDCEIDGLITLTNG